MAHFLYHPQSQARIQRYIVYNVKFRFYLSCDNLIRYIVQNVIYFIFGSICISTFFFYHFLSGKVTFGAAVNCDFFWVLLSRKPDHLVQQLRDQFCPALLSPGSYGKLYPPYPQCFSFKNLFKEYHIHLQYSFLFPNKKGVCVLINPTLQCP